MQKSEDASFTAKLKASAAAAQAASGVEQAVTSALEEYIAALTAKPMPSAELQQFALRLIQESRKKT